MVGLATEYGIKILEAISTMGLSNLNVGMFLHVMAKRRKYNASH